MENHAAPQPLDTLMTQLGLTNADLVKASTDQLSFKMVQKGRSGRRLTPNCQEKILKALLALKPDLKVKRRELFRYKPADSVVANILKALDLMRTNKIKYPEFIDLLTEAGINRYAVDTEVNRITFYGPGGEAHVEPGPMPHDTGTGSYEVNVRNQRRTEEAPKPQEKPAQKFGGTKKAVKTMKKGKTWKAVKLHRVKKWQFKRSY